MIKKIIKFIIIALIWIGIWQALAVVVGEELLLPSPVNVALRLVELLSALEFYNTVGYSLLRILLGMIAGTAIGTLGGIVTSFSRTAKDFFSPLLAIVKSTPVASFIILLVLYVSRDLTPLIIALMMVVPVVWSNVETGLKNTNSALLEMADAYKMSTISKISNIYVPSVSPYFFASLRSSLGMAWKAGIAAEVLLQPLVSIGKQIFESKHTLETTDLFAWTAVVIVLSVIIEKLTLFALKRVLKNHSFSEKGGVTLG